MCARPLGYENGGTENDGGAPSDNLVNIFPFSIRRARPWRGPRVRLNAAAVKMFFLDGVTRARVRRLRMHSVVKTFWSTDGGCTSARWSPCLLPHCSSQSPDLSHHHGSPGECVSGTDVSLVGSRIRLPYVALISRVHRWRNRRYGLFLEPDSLPPHVILRT